MLLEDEPPESVPTLVELESDDHPALRQRVDVDHPMEEPHLHGRIEILVASGPPSAVPNCPGRPRRGGRFAAGVGYSVPRLSGLRRPSITPSCSSDLNRCASRLCEMSGRPRRSSPNRWLPSSSSRRISGVQRSAKTSAPLAIGQTWLYPRWRASRHRVECVRFLHRAAIVGHRRCGWQLRYCTSVGQDGRYAGLETPLRGASTSREARR